MKVIYAGSLETSADGRPGKFDLYCWKSVVDSWRFYEEQNEGAADLSQPALTSTWRSFECRFLGVFRAQLK
jgi:hypothetical protein